MHLGSPDVSVLIAAYRAGTVLPRAVRSALDSAGVRVEVIVVDDASPDATFAVAEGLAADHRIRVARLERNGGPSAAHNRALEMARGRWVAVLDADELFHFGGRGFSDVLADLPAAVRGVRVRTAARK